MSLARERRHQSHSCGDMQERGSIESVQAYDAGFVFRKRPGQASRVACAPDVASMYRDSSSFPRSDTALARIACAFLINLAFSRPDKNSNVDMTRTLSGRRIRKLGLRMSLSSNNKMAASIILG